MDYANVENANKLTARTDSWTDTAISWLEQIESAFRRTQQRRPGPAAVGSPLAGAAHPSGLANPVRPDR